MIGIVCMYEKCSIYIYQIKEQKNSLRKIETIEMSKIPDTRAVLLIIKFFRQIKLTKKKDKSISQ